MSHAFLPLNGRPDLASGGGDEKSPAPCGGGPGSSRGESLSSAPRHLGATLDAGLSLRRARIGENDRRRWRFMVVRWPGRILSHSSVSRRGGGAGHRARRSGSEGTWHRCRCAGRIRDRLLACQPAWKKHVRRGKSPRARGDRQQNPERVPEWRAQGSNLAGGCTARAPDWRPPMICRVLYAVRDSVTWPPPTPGAETNGMPSGAHRSNRPRRSFSRVTSYQESIDPLGCLDGGQRPLSAALSFQQSRLARAALTPPGPPGSQAPESLVSTCGSHPHSIDAAGYVPGHVLSI